MKVAEAITTPAALMNLGTVTKRIGDELLVWYSKSDLSVREKTDASPVTAADMAAHHSLCRDLPTLLDGAIIPVISEEGEPNAEAIATLPSCWLVDPLDGTKDFIKKTDDFTINVALLNYGDLKAGCVVAPARGEVWVAARGLGAYKLSNTGDALHPVRTRPTPLDHPILLISRFHAARGEEHLQQAIPGLQTLAVGSALKYVRIAEGTADIAIREGPTCLWDTGAAQCILEEAGGALLQFNGVPLSYRTGHLINPPFVAIGDHHLPWRQWLQAMRPQPG